MEVIQIDPSAVESGNANYCRALCQALEQGNILTLSPTPFMPSEAECSYLRTLNQSASGSHKNIAYKPHLNRVTGVEAASSVQDTSKILGAYSTSALAFLSRLFPEYARQWKVDYASFRPVEEQGRVLPISHRNDLMHIDAFPTRPTHGGRILRAFTNIHPEKDRVWGTSWPFEELVAKYAKEAGLNQVTGSPAAAWRWIKSTGRFLGLKTPYRSAYDEFMLRFHHYLKANAEFQTNGQAHASVFTPGTTWIAFTDQVAHRVVSGQYAIEQTCIVPLEAMLMPSLAPANVLAKAAGQSLIGARRGEAETRQLRAG